jgi:superfamily I DNA/RNA helicase
LAERVQQFYDRGISWNDIAILYRSKWMAQRILVQLHQAQIPVEWVNRNSDSRHYHPAASSLKLITMHSSKGLEFPVVLIPGLGFLLTPGRVEAEEARLLYIAMTRAMTQLVITGDCSSLFVQRLERAIAKLD